MKSPHSTPKTQHGQKWIDTEARQAYISSCVFFLMTHFHQIPVLNPIFLLLSITCVVGLGAGPYRPIRLVLAQLQGWRTWSQQQRLSVWQAGTWDLCCNVCTWTNVSSNNITQRNCEGLNVTACMHSSGKFRTKIQKDQKNPNCCFWRAGSKNRVSVSMDRGAWWATICGVTELDMT